MRKFLGNALLTLALAALCMWMLFVVNRRAAPTEKILPPSGTASPDYASIVADIHESSLRKELQTFTQWPSRFSGSDGCTAAADYIAAALRQAGYRVIEQPFPVTVPTTRFARVLDDSGRAIEGVQIHPILPNWFRTCTTPTNGLRGTVYRGELGLAQEFSSVSLEGNFVMLPLGVSWGTVAGMGARAIFYFDDGRPNVGQNWDHHLEASLNVPRFLVTGDPTKLVGKTVTIEARVDFEQRTVRNVVGILDASGSDEEAVILNAFYDAYSYVPDVAQGANQACSPAVMLSVARQIAREAPRLKRSVVVVATPGHAQGLFGIREFLAALGKRDADASDANVAAKRLAELEKRLPSATKVLASDSQGANGVLLAEVLPAAEFENVHNRVMDDLLMSALEEVVRTRVDWVRDGMTVQGASFHSYSEARKREQTAKAIQATPRAKLKAETLSRFGVDLPQRQRAEARRWAQEIVAEHTRLAARAALAGELAHHKRVLFLGLDLSSRSGRIGLVCGEGAKAIGCQPADSEVAAQFARAGEELRHTDAGTSYLKTKTGQARFVNLLRERDARELPFVTTPQGAPLYFESLAVLSAGHTAFTLVTLDDDRKAFGTPLDTLDRMLDETGTEERVTESLCVVARMTAAAVSQLALGQGQIVPVSQASDLYTIRGDVLSQVGDSLTPDNPMPGAIVRFGPLSTTYYNLPGMGRDICLTADWHGRFALSYIYPHLLDTDYHPSSTIDAAVVEPEDGQILWALSTIHSGPLAPYCVRNVRITQYERDTAHAVVFRAVPVEIVPMPDPNTFKPFTVSFMEKKSLAAPKDSKSEAAGGCQVIFVPPDSELYFTFFKGRKDNPSLSELGAFALGAEEPQSSKLISGAGYLSADTPRISNIEFDAARSMVRVNGNRVEMQKRYGMADEMMINYNQKAAQLAKEANRLAAETNTVQAKLSALESVAYSSNIYPVIRKNASDAIWGILFYLFLAIPFAIFVEKLLIGHPDIRHQMAYQGLIFVVFFLALRLVHPAYALVQSSFMILLGFITFALATMVSGFVIGKFSKNIADLTKKIHQRVEAVDVSRGAAAATAFLLGLNNLRKRPVRTGLTVATLVLITFVMICFTSVRSDLVEVEFPVGKAPYTGLLVRDPSLASVKEALAPLRELYGDKHVLAPRAWGGNFLSQPGLTPELARYELIRTVGEKTFDAAANAILGLSVHEPKVTPILDTMLVSKRWFEKDTETSCLLPRILADELHLDEADVRAGTATVKIGGRAYAVLGIFDEAKLEAMLDVDGQSLLPIDVLSARPPGQQQSARASAESATAIPENVPRLAGRQVIITPIEAMPATERVASIAVSLHGQDYAAARKTITAHLERTGQMAYYGVDGIAFYGGRLRMGSLQGFVDLLLPIFLAALTVLNTMRGSVYERRTELYVFNAVGLLPTHIRWLFIAEASVYAVVGVVGGYLVAQAVGTVVKAFGLTAGLSINYSSLSCVVVSIVIMAVVFISSLFPARMAARLAAPAETMTRERRSATGDVIELDLPFTFNRRDRVAIIPYFVDWFADYGEGSAGDFFCSPPQCGVREEKQGCIAPFVQTTTWLKPYDLGVSQRVELVVRHDPKTNDNVATVVMTRQSGDRESWERCCHAFIGLLRKRFLTWRAIATADRDLLLERGRKLLEKEKQTVLAE
jgi:hypothetical protein